MITAAQTFKKYLIFLIGLGFSMSFLFFAMVNREMITIDLTPIPYILEIRLFIFAGSLFLIGIFCGWFVASFECRKRYLIHKDGRRKLLALEEENSILRVQHTKNRDNPSSHLSL
jgi:hypothetical protein